MEVTMFRAYRYASYGLLLLFVGLVVGMLASAISGQDWQVIAGLTLGLVATAVVLNKVLTSYHKAVMRQLKVDLERILARMNQGAPEGNKTDANQAAHNPGDGSTPASPKQ
jgi:uncharacterized membrane protein YeaQ/YmgE (transglycosylase-associated protein family)